MAWHGMACRGMARTPVARSRIAKLCAWHSLGTIDTQIQSNAIQSHANPMQSHANPITRHATLRCVPQPTTTRRGPKNEKLVSKNDWMDSNDMNIIPWPGTTRPRRGTKPA
mmetsp:Transcript_5084/g.11774  ORF Transcript_5084/g.11774 Transcript_5084/m.11774 type:complete len:111 (-) Transcript_5084:824-1156(-)